MKLNIGKVEIEGLTALGPMAGVTDPPFRLLCREEGADLLYTEMVSAKGVHFNNKNTNSLLFTAEGEHPVALQIFGEDPAIMAETAKRIEHLPFDILDINMGCPVPKVVNNGEGSALMKNPERIGRIVEAVSRATVKPVTVKIRRGFGKDETTAPECARIAQESGAAAVAVHGRTREQYYSGRADWGVIRAVKACLSIPVIGNGDVDSPEAAIRMLLETGCDMVMIGRAAQGNPWIFADVKAALNALPEDFLQKYRGVSSEEAKRLVEGLELPTVPKRSLELRSEMMLRHARELCEFKGETTAIAEMRKHVCWYTAGIPNSARLRASLGQIVKYQDLVDILAGLKEA